jgi:hypothetical protein
VCGVLLLKNKIAIVWLRCNTKTTRAGSRRSDYAKTPQLRRQ